MTTPDDLEVIAVVEAALLKRWPESRIEPSIKLKPLTPARPLKFEARPVEKLSNAVTTCPSSIKRSHK